MKRLFALFGLLAAGSSLAATLSGTVTDAGDGVTAVHPVSIELFHVDTLEFIGISHTNAGNGSYSVDVPEGNYYLFFDAYEAASSYQDELYDGIPCTSFSCDVAGEGAIVSIAAEGRTIDVDLEPGLTISGKVTNELLEPLAGVVIEVFGSDGAAVCCSVATDDDGRWAYYVSLEGNYFARTVPETTPDYFAEIWLDKSCDGCDPLAVGTSIEVGGEGAAGIDFELASKAGPPTACQLRQLEIIFRAGFENAQGTFECKRLHAVAGEGGSIISTSGDNDCRETLTCEFDIGEGNGFTDTFTAQPRPGYLFSGWKAGEVHLCDDTITPCTVEGDSGLALQINGNPVIEAVFEPDGSIYFPTSDSLTVCSMIDLPEIIDTECEIKSFELYGYGKLEDYVVTNNLLFVDTKARNKELDLLSQEEREVWCEAQVETENYANFTPTPPVDIWDDVALDEMALPLYWARIHHDYLGNQDASGLILRSLLSYAIAGVWLGVDIKTDGENRQYNLALNMLLYELAWKSIREEELVSIEQREVIDQYFYELHRIISDSPGKAHDCDELEACSEVFNHSWSRDLASMASGVLTKNNELFRIGIKGFFAILDGVVRPDGSHYHESRRGGTATLYSVNATSTMIRMAELATNQGFNLYDVEIDGISLHTIIEFHLRVLEDEVVIHQYAKHDMNYADNRFCEPDVCDDWNNQAKYWNFDQPWSEFELYRRRFPSSPLVERYLALYPADEHKTPPTEGPILHVCEFREVSE